MAPLRRWRDRKRPALSIVIPVYNGAGHLDQCLRSVLHQNYGRIEVVVVDDGSTDSSMLIARSHQESDDRVVVISQANAGVGAARSAGTAVASGAYLTFVDADDTVTPGGIRAAMGTLEQTGSDLAVMPYQRQEGALIRPPAPWIRALHAHPAKRTTLAERPDVLVHAIACAKIFRRDFWDSAGLEFPSVLLAGDQIVSARACREAKAIDITGAVAYNWRRQESSISQGQVTAEAVHARMDAADAVLEILDPLPEVRGERALQLLRYNVPNSVLKLERADDAYLDALMERVPRIVAAAPPGRYAAEVPAQFRVLYELIRKGERKRIWDYVRAEGMQVEMHPSGVEAAGFTVYLPGWASDAVPAEAYVLAEGETPFQAKILRAHRLGIGEFALDVQAWFRNVGLESNLEAVVRADGVPLDVRVRRNGTDVIVGSRQGAERRYRGSGWTIDVSHEARSLPRFLDVELSLTAGPFAGSKSFARFRTSRIEAV